MDWVKIGTLAGSIGIAIMELYHRLLKDRMNVALKREEIIHEELLKEIKRLIVEVEKVSDPYLVNIRKLRQESYLDLLLSSKIKKEMKKLKELAERYGMMGHITERLVTQTIEESVDDYLKNTNKKMDVYLKENFALNFTSSFIKIAVTNKEDIDTRWFEKIKQYFSKNLNDNIENEDSLIKFSKDLNQKIKSEDAIVFLKEERKKLDSQAKKIKGMLEKEKKKLTSWYSFWYGSREIRLKIDNFEKKEKENNRPKYL